MARKILIVIDMQKDFIDGALGTEEAVSIVPAVVDKIKEYDRNDVLGTLDTHQPDYLNTQEGRYLPVEHCIKGTPGWELQPEIAELIPEDHLYEKPTFGSAALASDLRELAAKEDIEVELVGLCTDICVVSNALLIKAFIPEVKISVDPSCCAGVTPAKHEAALETMRSCQIQIGGSDVVPSDAAGSGMKGPEELTDREIYDTSIGKVCMSKAEHEAYLDELEEEKLRRGNLQ